MFAGRFFLCLLKSAVGALALCTSLVVFAQALEAPISCPTSAVVNDAVCAIDELRQGAFEVEKKYLSALVTGDYSQVLMTKLAWTGQYLQCGYLIGRGHEMSDCIKSSFNEFGANLQKLAPTLEKERSFLQNAAQARMESVVGTAKKRRAICIQAKAAIYDDGVSSARDIAIVIAKDCRPTAYELARALAAQIEVSRPLFSRDIPSAEAILSLSQDLSNPDDFVPTILERRAANRTPAKPSSKTKPKTLGV